MASRLSCSRANHPVFPPAEERVSSFRRRARPAPLPLAALVAALPFLVACDASRGPAPAEAATAPGAARVVSTLPSATDLILALGAGDRLVARTGFDRDPRVAHLPSLGRTLWPAPEAVRALAPDLVVAPADQAGSRVAARLAAAGVPVLVANLETTADLFELTARLGSALGLVARADSLVAALRAGLDDAARAYRSAAPPTVVYVLWHGPPRTAGPGTFLDELIRAAGGENAFGDVAGRWPEVSMEALLARDPDVLVVPRRPGAPARPVWLDRRPGWGDLRAVRGGRVVFVDAELFQRPGPRIAEAAHVLGAALHGAAGHGVAGRTAP